MRCKVHGFRRLMYFGFTFTWRVFWGGTSWGQFPNMALGRASVQCVCVDLRVQGRSVYNVSL